MVLGAPGGDYYHHVDSGYYSEAAQNFLINQGIKSVSLSIGGGTLMSNPNSPWGHTTRLDDIAT